MLDANVNDAVGDFFLARGYVVDFVNKSFLPKTPDADLNAIAQLEGWIIVSYDQEFLKKIQQPRYGFPDSARSGYGRIMFLVRLSQQLERIERCFDIIEHIYARAHESERRLLLTIGPNWIRYDDEPLPRTAKTRKQPQMPAE